MLYLFDMYYIDTTLFVVRTTIFQHKYIYYVATGTFLTGEYLKKTHNIFSNISDTDLKKN